MWRSMKQVAYFVPLAVALAIGMPLAWLGERLKGIPVVGKWLAIPFVVLLIPFQRILERYKDLE